MRNTNDKLKGKFSFIGGLFEYVLCVFEYELVVVLLVSFLL